MSGYNPYQYSLEITAVVSHAFFGPPMDCLGCVTTTTTMWCHDSASGGGSSISYLQGLYGKDIPASGDAGYIRHTGVALQGPGQCVSFGTSNGVSQKVFDALTTSCARRPAECPTYADAIARSHLFALLWLGIATAAFLYFALSSSGKKLSRQRVRHRSHYVAMVYSLSALLAILWTIESAYHMTVFVVFANTGTIAPITLSFLGLYMELISRHFGYRLDGGRQNPTGACCTSILRGMFTFFPKIWIHSLLMGSIVFSYLGMGPIMSPVNWVFLAGPRWSLYFMCPLLLCVMIGVYMGVGPWYHLDRRSFTALNRALDAEIHERYRIAQMDISGDGSSNAKGDTENHEADVIQRPKFLLWSLWLRCFTGAIIPPCCAVMAWIWISIAYEKTVKYDLQFADPLTYMVGISAGVGAGLFWIQYQNRMTVRFYEVAIVQHQATVYSSIVTDVARPLMASYAFTPRSATPTSSTPTTTVSGYGATEDSNKTMTNNSTAASSTTTATQPIQQVVRDPRPGALIAIAPRPTSNRPSFEEQDNLSASFLRSHSPAHLLEGIQALSPILTLFAVGIFTVSVLPLFGALNEGGFYYYTAVEHYTSQAAPLVLAVLFCASNLAANVMQQYAFAAGRAQGIMAKKREAQARAGKSGGAVAGGENIPLRLPGDHALHDTECRRRSTTEDHTACPSKIEEHGLAYRTLAWGASWQGQQVLTLFNHAATVVVTFFGIVLHKFQGSQALTLATATLGVSSIGLITTSMTFLSRRFPILKVAPTDDSFRMTVLFKATLLGLKAQVLLLSPSGYDYIYFGLFAFSVITLAVFTFVNVITAWRKRHIFNDIHLPRVLLIGYAASYVWVKLASLVLVVISFYWSTMGTAQSQFPVIFFSTWVVIISYANNEMARYLQGRMDEEERKESGQPRRLGIAMSCGGMQGVLPYVGLVTFSGSIAFFVVANPDTYCRFLDMPTQCVNGTTAFNVMFGLLVPIVFTTFVSLKTGDHVAAKHLSTLHSAHHTTLAEESMTLDSVYYKKKKQQGDDAGQGTVKSSSDATSSLLEGKAEVTR